MFRQLLRSACKPDKRLYNFIALFTLLLTSSVLVPNQQVQAKNFSGAVSPIWSPDGKRIAYIVSWQGQQSLYLTDLAGTTPVWLANNASEPTWSPDGKKIAFTSNLPDIPTISILSLESKIQTTLTSGSTPKWSPDGKQIAYLVGGSLHIAPSDGAVPRHMITDATTSVGDFAWSPDGKHIAISASGKSEESSVIEVMNPDGTGLYKIADGTYNVSFSWSPDSSQLAFVGICNQQQTDYVCTVNADGSNPHALFAYLGLQPIRTNWSPDGKRLLYTFGGQVCLMHSDGSNRQCLTKLQSYSNDMDVSWSPDGNHIMFIRMNSPQTAGTEPDFYSTVYIMNANGSDLHHLFDYTNIF